jgi:hypothetical protein
VDDPPTPTDEEHEQGHERRQDEEATRGAGHDDPDEAEKDDSE